MRLITLLLLFFLCTCARAQTMRVDTVDGPTPGYITFRYVTEMPEGAEMSKADRFLRGIGPNVRVGAWERLDSLMVIDGDGVRVPAGEVPEARPPLPALPDDAPYFDEQTVHLDGRLGAAVSTTLRVNNPRTEGITLSRTDKNKVLKTDRNQLSVPGKGSSGLTTTAVLPAGSATHAVRMSDGEATFLELRLVLNGYDLKETDFSPDESDAPVWTVPEGRETLYLRLRSTEKLMTIYHDGRVYSRVAVGRQLDEINLSGLGAGRYSLEVDTLAPCPKRSTTTTVRYAPLPSFTPK